MQVVRWFLGTLILFFDKLFTPSGIKREASIQADIDKQTAFLSLYQFAACPFCVKVRRAIKRNSLNIEVRDAKNCQVTRQQLLTEGGKIKVPCLRIEDEQGNARWMYESSDIINYLESRFS